MASRRVRRFSAVRILGTDRDDLIPGADVRKNFGPKKTGGPGKFSATKPVGLNRPPAPNSSFEIGRITISRAFFEKEGDNTFDGFDSKQKYQMVPVRDARKMQVVTVGAAYILSVRDPDVATMADFFTADGPFPTPSLTSNALLIPPDTRIAFSIVGKAEGATILTLEDPTGEVLDSLLVSVKTKVTKDFAICLLSDKDQKNKTNRTDAIPTMQDVRTIFLKQANLELNRTVSPVAVNVPRDLGRPFDPTKPGVLAAVLDATPPALRNQIVVYCCWEIARAKEDDAGITLSNQYSFIEDGANAHVFAHEIGHALKLKDRRDNVRRLMFFSTAGQSNKLDQFEIDDLNRSGTVT
jgi:hypothetical protein